MLRDIPRREEINLKDTPEWIDTINGTAIYVTPIFDGVKYCQKINDYIIYGEMVGRNVNDNPLGINHNLYLVTDVYGEVEERFLTYHEVWDFCSVDGLDRVPTWYSNIVLYVPDVEALEKFAKGKYSLLHSFPPDSDTEWPGVIIRDMNNEWAVRVEAD